MNQFLLQAGSLFLEETPAEVPAGNMITTLLVTILPFVVLIYFMIIRPEKKRKKKEAQMFEELMVGSEVTTRGGIIGRVVNIKDDTIILESGSDKCRIKMLRSAIATVNTPISD